MEHLYQYRKSILIIFTIFIVHFSSNAQGCVAIRSGCGVNIGGGAILPKGSWQTGANFRYFHSYRHFRGKHEEAHRVEQGTEVINDSYFLDLQLSYGLSDRVSLNFALPFVYHERSSMYEHGGNPPNGLGDRHMTYSQGLADIRMGASYWLLDPSSHTNRNFSVGLGVKLPSGDYRAQSAFYNQGDTDNQTIMSGVDQSIQPGDGGFGLTIDLQGYQALSDNLLLNGSFYYLVNPKEKYTLETRGRTRDFSIADQYAARLGVLYVTPLQGFSLYGGSRIEGVPSSDLIGGDEGWRRPGYAVSLEPGINYNFLNFSLNLTVPVAIERARTQNFSDKQSGDNGDAAFADYLINFGFAWRIGGQAPKMDHIEARPIDIVN